MQVEKLQEHGKMLVEQMTKERADIFELSNQLKRAKEQLKMTEGAYQYNNQLLAMMAQEDKGEKNG